MNYGLADLCTDFYDCIYSEQDAAALASILADQVGILTLHYKIPQPTGTGEIEEFRRILDKRLWWQQTYSFLHILSFDVWYPNVLSLIQESVLLWEDSGTQLAFEDYCLTEMPVDVRAFAAKHSFYELAELVHMSYRLHQGGKDIHASLSEPTLLREPDGTVSVNGIIQVLWELHLDSAIVTIETMPFLYGHSGADGDASVLADLHYVRQVWDQLSINRGVEGI